eukprot:CAMPEP_0195289502 /NCGR_PEP_ID=MMETSP0707-20130614/5754_1 /TAXON_ID=33640 /ORGANISM="Asterionellopsis glacialis, Strain CCMP134" /LENGTH=415 /DNA_ID=CAMNT_0040349517 /DNA_START=156 /DNA_END=1403 /DNA_ORIENTATION=+
MKSSFRISATAPKFTHADEKREMSKLTDAEIRGIADDVYGNSNNRTRHEHHHDDTNSSTSSNNAPSSPSTPAPPKPKKSVTPEELASFELELSKLPLSDKTSYERALFECPELIVKESNPERFLLNENHHAERAAKKLALYWEMRQSIFGEKAFLPMTLEGAMSDLVPTMLVFPNLSRCIFDVEEHGRIIIFGNHEGVDLNELDPGALVRMLWYNLHLAMKHDDEQQKRRQEQQQPQSDNTTKSNITAHGLVAVNFGRRLTLDQFNRRRNRLIVKSVCEYIPVQVQAVHLVTCSLFIEQVLPLVKWYMGRRLRFRIRLHQGPDKEILQSLVSYGVDLRDSMHVLDPRDYESSIWIANQIERERREQQQEKDANEALHSPSPTSSSRTHAQEESKDDTSIYQDLAEQVETMNLKSS